MSSVDAITKSAAAADAVVRIFLVDDASTDGTGDAIYEAFPSVTVIRGTGSLYWNRGMSLAWEFALREPPDFYLWLNDDLAVEQAALANALALYWARMAEHASRVIVVGRCVDPDTGETSYGGYRHSRGLSRLRFRRLKSDESRCDTMNGNFVLIPSIATSDVGLNDRVYRHSFGDIDYGLRASKNGYGIIELKEPVGVLAVNKASEAGHTTMRLKDFPIVVTDPKRVPANEWLYFCRQHGGPLWPANFLVRYVKMALKGARVESYSGTDEPEADVPIKDGKASRPRPRTDPP